MATGANIPSLSDDDKVLVFQILGVYLNQTILFALLQGIYIGMVAFTLSRMFSRRRDVGINAMALVIIVLCILTTINFVFYWLFTVCSFIHHGQTFSTVIMAFDGPSDMETLARVSTGISACISTVVADSAMVWRCWIVWGRRWIIILLPLVFMVLGVAFKILQIRTIVQGTEPRINYKTCTTIYISLTLATTLLCTLLIVYRILKIIVESAALYSTVLIVYIGFTFQDEVGGEYLDPIAEVIRGVAPTLLVGRVASGHSRPDDSWKGSTISSLHFGTGQHTHTGTETRTEEDLMRSDNFAHNVEAQAPVGPPDNESVSSERAP
ncbi:hypothetical protein F5146DRAFT_1227443 [Armillaria mellea]|nr:hypothetical protein F5146DRAFT_1227443 [Armillaria mellea]